MGRRIPASVRRGAVSPRERLGTNFAEPEASMQPEISRMEPRESVVDIPRKPRNTRKRNLIVAACVVAGVVVITLALSRLRAAAPVVILDSALLRRLIEKAKE